MKAMYALRLPPPLTPSTLRGSDRSVPSTATVSCQAVHRWCTCRPWHLGQICRTSSSPDPALPLALWRRVQAKLPLPMTLAMSPSDCTSRALPKLRCVLLHGAAPSSVQLVGETDLTRPSPSCKFYRAFDAGFTWQAAAMTAAWTDGGATWLRCIAGSIGGGTV